MTLPVEYRSEVRFEQDLIAREWPELLDFPFNEQVKVGRLRRRIFGLADAARTTRAAAGLRVVTLRRPFERRHDESASPAPSRTPRR